MSDDAALLLSRSGERTLTVTINEHLLVLSVLDDLAIGTGSDFGHDYRTTPYLHLHAEAVTLTGTFQASNLLLAAQALTVAGPPTAAVSVAGRDGQNADPTAPATSGANGGDLCVFLQDAGTTEGVTYDAHGGAGGAGLDVAGAAKGGDGMAGGPGGTVVVVGAHDALAWLARLLTVFALTTPKSKAAELARVLAEWPAAGPFAPLAQPLDAARTTGDGPTIDAALKAAGGQLQDMAHAWQAATENSIDISAGGGGVWGTGQPNGNSGHDGTPGNATALAIGRPQELLAASWPAFGFAHPSQCAMVLEKAKLMYLVLDPVNEQQVTDLVTVLLRLEARTAPFVGLDPASPLGSWYTTNAVSVGVANPISQLGSINAQANTYRSQLAAGRDVYGFAHNHVPLASYDFYSKQLDRTALYFKEIEDSYNQRFDQLDAHDATDDAVAAARKHADDLIDTENARIAVLQPLVASVGRVIDGYELLLPSKLTALTNAIDAAAKAAAALPVDLGDVIAAMQQVAFDPESAPMAAAQAAGLAWSSQKVTDDAGDKINRQYLVDQVRQVSAGLDSLKEGHTALDDGTLQPDDPGAAKLLADQATFETTLGSFAAKVPFVANVNALFTDYVSTITARNTAILRYNAAVFMLRRSRAAAAAAAERQGSLNAEAMAQLQSDAPDLTAFVSKAYYTARAQVMELLYQTARAFNFWALQDGDHLLAEVYGGAAPPALDSVALTNAQTTLLQHYDDAVGAIGQDADRFPTDASLAGVLVPLGSADLKLLRDTGQAIIRVPFADPTTTKAQNPFAGLAEVRLFTVRLWLESTGPITSDDSLSMTITHTGDETIVSRSGDLFHYSHDPVTVPFVYRPSDKKIWQEEEHSLAVTGRGDDTYALLGPFTLWHVTVPVVDNKDLNLTTVTAATLEFSGNSYTFN